MSQIEAEVDMSPEKMREVASALAQQNAMARGPRFLDHGSRLFIVEKGWESQAIRETAQAAVCGSLLDLEQALRAADTMVILIPHDALVTDADIEKLCARNAAARTIFREVDKA